MKNISKLTHFISKGYGGTWSIVVLILIYAYVGRPVEPWMPTKSELTEINGVAVYKYLPAAKSSVSANYLEVGGLVLNCNFGYFGGQGGCAFSEVRWDMSKPVCATYFWMPTRLGFGDRMLHSLTQNGQLVISPQRTFDDRILGYEIGWNVYYQLLIAGVLLAVIMWLIERLNAKRNTTLD